MAALTRSHRQKAPQGHIASLDNRQSDEHSDRVCRPFPSKCLALEHCWAPAAAVYNKTRRRCGNVQVHMFVRVPCARTSHAKSGCINANSSIRSKRRTRAPPALIRLYRPVSAAAHSPGTPSARRNYLNWWPCWHSAALRVPSAPPTGPHRCSTAHLTSCSMSGEGDAVARRRQKQAGNALEVVDLRELSRTAPGTALAE